MTSAALSDHRQRHQLIIDGPIVKAADWLVLGGAQELVDQAHAVLASVRAEVGAAREQGHQEGHHSGRQQALNEFASSLAGARELRERLSREHERLVIDLATSMLMHIAPSLGADKLVPALATEALRAAVSRQRITVRVSPAALEATSKTMAAWPRNPGQMSIDVIADDSLGDFGCVVETEVGEIRAGLDEQLAVLHHALHSDVDNDGELRGAAG